MLDTNIREVSRGLGLTALERTSVRAAEASLPYGWRVTFEAIDSDDTDDVYARVIPPWNANVSAFLIDREGHWIIVTDNVSTDTHPVLKAVCEVRDAIEYVTSVVSGAEFARAR